MLELPFQTSIPAWYLNSARRPATELDCTIYRQKIQIVAMYKSRWGCVYLVHARTAGFLLCLFHCQRMVKKLPAVLP